MPRLQRPHWMVFAFALVLWVQMSQTAWASDFSEVAIVALGIVIAVALGCLFAGFVTSAVVYLITKQKWVWFLIPAFSAFWFVMGWLMLSVFE